VLVDCFQVLTVILLTDLFGFCETDDESLTLD